MNHRIASLALALALALLVSACPDEAPPPKAPVLRGSAPVAFKEHIPPLPEGARTLAVTVSDRGYEPASLEAHPKESIILAFTRVTEAECGRYVKVVGTDTQAELPLNETVKIPVQMPESGEVTFVCGMDMMRGVVKVVPIGAAPAE